MLEYCLVKFYHNMVASGVDEDLRKYPSFVEQARKSGVSQDLARERAHDAVSRRIQQRYRSVGNNCAPVTTDNLNTPISNVVRDDRRHAKHFPDWTTITSGSGGNVSVPAAPECYHEVEEMDSFRMLLDKIPRGSEIEQGFKLVNASVNGDPVPEDLSELSAATQRRRKTAFIEFAKRVLRHAGVGIMVSMFIAGGPVTAGTERPNFASGTISRAVEQVEIPMASKTGGNSAVMSSLASKTGGNSAVMSSLASKTGGNSAVMSSLASKTGGNSAVMSSLASKAGGNSAVKGPLASKTGIG